MANRTGTSDLALLHSRIEFYAKLSFGCACTLVALCVVGLFGNCLSLFVFSRRNMRKKSINVLLIGLSISDLCLLFLAIPVLAVQPLTAGKINSHILHFTFIIIAYVYPVATIFQTCSVWIFILITIERYLAVCHPFKAMLYLTPGRAIRSLFPVFCLACLYNVVRFWEYRLVCYSDTNQTCHVFMEHLLRGYPRYQLWYGTGGYFLTQLLLPCLTMGVLNAQIVKTVLKSRKRRASLSTVELTEQKTSVMMVVVVVIFVLCYSLSFVLNLYEALEPLAFNDPMSGPVLFFINDLSNTLVVANSATTFIVYLVLSENYRRITYNAFAKLLQKELLPVSGRISSMKTVDFISRSGLGKIGEARCSRRISKSSTCSDFSRYQESSKLLGFGSRASSSADEIRREISPNISRESSSEELQSTKNRVKLELYLKVETTVHFPPIAEAPENSPEINKVLMAETFL